MDQVRGRFGQDAVIRGKLYDRVKARSAKDSEDENRKKKVARNEDASR
jgi:DNA polymerase-4